MTLTRYRQTLGLRGIKSLLVVAALARIPITAGTVTRELLGGENDRAQGRNEYTGADDDPFCGCRRCRHADGDVENGCTDREVVAAPLL